MPRLAMLIASLALALATVVCSGPTSVVTAQEGYSPDGEEWAFVDLVNAYRVSLGIGPVTMNYELGAAADYHSIDMANNNYFDHYSLDGTDPGTNIQRFGYTGSPWAENIAAGMATAQEVLIGWQNSPDHDATMRNPSFTEIGIGRAYNENSHYGWYWTATYGGGEAAPVAPEPLPAPVVEPDPGVVTTVDASVLEPEPVVVNAVEAPVVEAPVVEAPLETVTTVNEAPSVTTDDGGVVELQQDVVDADGDRAVSTGASPVADGTGDTIIYGDINTGGVQGETIVYEPPSLTVSGDTTTLAPTSTSTAPAPVTTTTTAAPPPETTKVISNDPTLTETTVTNISMEDGNGRAIG